VKYLLTRYGTMGTYGTGVLEIDRVCVDFISTYYRYGALWRMGLMAVHCFPSTKLGIVFLRRMPFYSFMLWSFYQLHNFNVLYERYFKIEEFLSQRLAYESNNYKLWKKSFYYYWFHLQGNLFRRSITRWQGFRNKFKVKKFVFNVVEYSAD